VSTMSAAWNITSELIKLPVRRRLEYRIEISSGPKSEAPQPKS
jgi:hypothetical protein